MTRSYSYFADGSLSTSALSEDGSFNRAYEYDHAGRLKSDTTPNNFAQDLTYDVWGNVTQSVGWHWSQFISATGTYANNRNAAWQYNAAGQVTSNGDNAFAYDAAGQISKTWKQGLQPNGNTMLYDGDGQLVRGTNPLLYNLRSTVLGGRVVAEILNTGQRTRGFVYAEGEEVLALQNDDTNNVVWEHRDAAEQSVRQADNTGAVVDEREQTVSGAKIEPVDPYPTDPGFTGADTDGEYPHLGIVGRPTTGCTLEGVALPECYILEGLSSFDQAYLSWKSQRYYDRLVYRATIGIAFQESNIENDTLKSWIFDVAHLYTAHPTALWNDQTSWQTQSITTLQKPSKEPIDPRRVPHRLLSNKEMQYLRDFFYSILAKEKCRTFLEDFLNKAAKDNPNITVLSKDIKGMFESIASGAGFWSAPGASYNSIGGDIRKNTGAIFFSNDPRFYSHGPVNRRAERAFLSGTFHGMAQTAIHELFHHAGFGDRALANTAALIQKETVKFADSWEGTLAASNYWTKLLDKNCY